MLISFKISNFSSFNEEQELLMTPALEAGDDLIIETGLANPKQLLPLAVILGANASGKSNFVKAFQFLYMMIDASWREFKDDQNIPFQTFKLNKSTREGSMILAIEFLCKGIHYCYGFEASKKQIDREWLQRIVNEDKVNIYSRELQDFTFGEFEGDKDNIKAATRPNSLFFSTAVQFNNIFLRDLKQHLHETELFDDINVEESDVIGHYREANAVRIETILFLKEIGTGIKDIKIKATKLSEEEINKLAKGLIEAKFPIEVQNSILKHNSTLIEFDLIHQDDDGKNINFELSDESSGTRRLLILLDRVFEALEKGSVLIVDEIETSIHSKISEGIVQLFKSKDHNKNGAQLIVTTHNTNILSPKMNLRKDEIWFAKKVNGATVLESLSEYKTPPDGDFESKYLEGSFGATPFIGSLTDLVANAEQ